MSLKKLGRYDLIRVLGKGAMGLVYEGRDPNLDRRVAIKTIKVENLSDEAAAEYEVRFRTEARSAARLQHPNIVSVYDSDRDIDIAYLVMEFVQGDDLKHHLDKGEVYTLAQTLSIMDDLLSALSYAHSQGVVHRDIKPANLLVIAGGRIKLADFGVARIQDSGDATRTQGTIVGTLKYMSPEQLEGKPIDSRTDLFAAGVVLYQLVTGQRPFDGETDFAVIQKIVSHQPAAPTSFNAKLPPALDAVVAKSLAKSRDARYATAQEFAQALQLACKQASDVTIAPVAIPPARGSNNTWTATMMPGESLVSTHSGVGTSGTSGTSASLVTQEVELVYWKDIKDSDDIEDLQGFLTKFPSGIYADLARRRLRNLGVTTSADSAEVNQLMARLPMPQAGDNDKTVMQTRPLSSSESPSAEPATHPEVGAPMASEPKHEPQPEPDVAAAQPPEPSPPAPKKTSMLWLAGVAVLAVVGVVFKMLSGSGSSTDLAAQTAAPVLAASSAASSAASAAPGTASSMATTSTTTTTVTTTAGAVLPAVPASSSALAAASPAAAMTPASRVARPLLAASKAPNVQAVMKGSTEKQLPATQEPVVVPEPVTPAAPAKPVTSAAATPRAACEGRVLFGFQNCMSEQCAKPVFFQHPTCVERRAMDEQRRETERNR